MSTTAPRRRPAAIVATVVAVAALLATLLSAGPVRAAAPPSSPVFVSWPATTTVTAGTPLAAGLSVGAAPDDATYTVAVTLVRVTGDGQGGETTTPVTTWTATLTDASQQHALRLPTGTVGAASYGIDIEETTPTGTGTWTVAPVTVTVEAAPPSHPLAVTLGDVPSRLALGRATPLRGTVTDRTTRRAVPHARVALQVRTRHGWVTPPGGTLRADRAGRFTLPAPTFYYGTHAFRAYAGPQPLRAGVTGRAAASAMRSVSVPVPYRPAGSPRAGATYPHRFDPCRPIPYVINYSGAPRNARTLVRTALAKARAATGLTFTYAGSTSGVPFSSQPGSGMPERGLGFAWTTPSRVRQLAGSNIGVGGGQWSGDHGLVAAGVSVDRTFRFRPGWTGPNSIGGLLLHELGHALGLKHVTDRQQQMYPQDVGAPNGDYNAGDLAALSRIGLDAGCA